MKMKMTPTWYKPDLRDSFDKSASVKNGTLYLKQNTIQVWWTHNSLNQPFNTPCRETWACPTIKDANENFEDMAERFNE